MSILANRATWLVVLAALGIGLAVGLVFGSTIDDAEAAKKKKKKTLWAVVNVDGNLVRGSGVTDVNLAGDPAYGYYVTFDRDISDCAYLATQGQDGGSYLDPGEVSTSLDLSGDGPGPLGHDVLVQFGDSDSGGGNVLRPFYLGVLC